jgi:hypothetical protein
MQIHHAATCAVNTRLHAVLVHAYIACGFALKNKAVRVGCFLAHVFFFFTFFPRKYVFLDCCFLRVYVRASRHDDTLWVDDICSQKAMYVGPDTWLHVLFSMTSARALDRVYLTLVALCCLPVADHIQPCL